MRVIAIVNQKGGCGKTTTTVNLGGALEADGARVLVVDLDPQAHATLALGIDPDELDENLYEVLAEPGGAQDLERIIINVLEGIDLAPSSRSSRASVTTPERSVSPRRSPRSKRRTTTR
jgi:chromosome partitioning protein